MPTLIPAVATARPPGFFAPATPAGTVSGWDGPARAEPPPARRTPWPLAIGALALALAIGAAFLLLGEKPSPTTVAQPDTAGSSVNIVPTSTAVAATAPEIKPAPPEPQPSTTRRLES